MELARAMAEYSEDFSNAERRHSSHGSLAPNEFKDLHSTATQQATLT